MHEISLAEGVLQIIEDAARIQKFARVNAIWLEIGQLAGVEIQALTFCLESVTRGSVAQGAEIKVLSTPGSGWCAHCAGTVSLSEAFAACPQCGGFAIRVTGGTQMRVKELEVE